MTEGTSAKLVIGDYEYKVGHYKIEEKVGNFFCGSVTLRIDDDVYPDVVPFTEAYNAKLIVNGDALWYFPWVWFQKVDPPHMEASLYGAVFCPMGLTEDDEDKYDSIKLIMTSNICYSMTTEVWHNLLLVFADWLTERSIPQAKQYVELADAVLQDTSDEEEAEDPAEVLSHA